MKFIKGTYCFFIGFIITIILLIILSTFLIIYLETKNIQEYILNINNYNIFSYYKTNDGFETEFNPLAPMLISILGGILSVIIYLIIKLLKKQINETI